LILEGLVTTMNEDGSANIAPMGPRVEPEMRRFVLRPFKTATTYRNLKRLGEGVLHVTDDVLMLARGAIGEDPRAETRAADVVQGRVILGACRYYEFRVTAIDDRNDRTTIEAETVASGVLREYFGLNRAKHAVVEAAILATRVGILPMDEIAEDFRRLVAPVEKTGGPDEIAAFALLTRYVRDRGIPVADFPRP
jgi:hypothetical protein